ncbi:ArgE/DapE family deacylase [Streptomyces sp. NBC_00893]|uniref:ArgE/DapE family deacylase n=1 Tax=Streptomyces sp. NBC_00893 TaxID=2975862 RepID=UPI00225675C8|nr:ArgE/DapE family deacylase [Streptomyces sp. NBC_00893]MCX4851719.1 ArgE/DapE family deacylase [Streptomyces sp. NBC_00893]
MDESLNHDRGVPGSPATSTRQRVLTRLDLLRGEMLETLTAAVQIPSITPTYPGEVYADLVGAEGEVSRLLAEVYAEAGAETDVFAVEPGRDNAVGVIQGTGGGRSLIFNGHVDVVPPGDTSGWRSGDPFDGAVEDGWIRGRGTVDMKSGLVAQAFAARALHEAGVRLRGDLILQAVVGEENLENHLGTSAVLDRGYTADGAIVSEPTGGAWPLSVMAATPGLLVMRIEVVGKSSHSSMRGRMLCRPSTTEAVAASAIDRGFVIYQALRRLESDWAVTKFDPLFEPGHFTLAPGVVDGGARHSRSGAFIPDSMSMVYAVFHPPGEDQAVVRKEIEGHIAHVAATDPWLRAHPPVVEWPLRYPGSRVDATHPLCVAVTDARELAAVDTPLAGRPPVAAFPSAADSTWLCTAGVPAVGLGPGELAMAHAYDERCAVDEIVCAARAYALAAMDWCGS